MISTCMVVFSYYPADPRPRREAEALAEIGMSVDVICLRAPGESKKEFVNGVCVHRLPLQRKRAGKLRYLWEYAYFILLSFFKLSILHLRKRYNLVHVHNMPDILVFSALVPRLTGAKVILDLHDPMPELYMTKYAMLASHPIIKLLLFLEKISIRFSNLVLTPNIAFSDLFISRSCPMHKIQVVMNSPQEMIFCGNNQKKKKDVPLNRDGFVIMYHGTIVERNGLNIALEAIASLRNKIPNLVFHVYGEGDFVESFLKRVAELNMRDIVIYHGQVSLETIAEAIGSIDIGLIPNKSSPFTNINLPTRIFEYLCMEKPVIAPRTKGIWDYFDEESLFFFEAGNAENLAEVILEVYNNTSKCQAVLEKGIKIYQKHRWELERLHFVKLVKNLLSINENQITKKSLVEEILE